MPFETQIDQIAERVERLLLRHAELMQRNEALEHELDQACRERDAMARRLAHACARLDALLEQLPKPEGDPA